MKPVDLSKYNVEVHVSSCLCPGDKRVFKSRDGGELIAAMPIMDGVAFLIATPKMADEECNKECSCEHKRRRTPTLWDMDPDKLVTMINQLFSHQQAANDNN